MKRLSAAASALLVTVFAVFGCANPPSAQSDAGWITLFDGTSFDNWVAVGDANWRLADGAAVADAGNGFLVTRSSYRDFQVRAEFWVDDNANSGIFIRCTDPKTITAKNAYEVNIFDKRPDPTYGTGAIVYIAKVEPMPKAGGKWNVYEITAKGAQLTVTLNGARTVDVQDTKYPGGPIALQYGAGVVKFRKVQVRAL